MKRVPIILFGAGGVGRALLRQIVNGRAALAGRNGLQFNVVAIADSKSWIGNPAGLSDEAIAEALAAKQKRRPIGPDASEMLPDEAELESAERGQRQALVVKSQQRLAGMARISDVEILEQLAGAGLERAIIVDVTASDGMEPLIDRALELEYGVVLANKKPLAGPWERAQRYFNQPRLRHESTVGGGQPVIATLRYLLDTNDPIKRIQGQLSGTLGFICSKLDEGMPFSQALALAKAKGYTEPDPREDLGGKDVRRKLLILGRMAGWPMEAEDISVESLYPPALAHLPVQEFMAAALALDPSLRDRVNAAGAAGEVLRYVAELSGGRGSVGLKPIPADSALANLKYISFQTELYDDEPLLIGGKGAGVEMTAAGVLGDMIGLARENL